MSHMRGLIHFLNCDLFDPFDSFDSFAPFDLHDCLTIFDSFDYFDCMFVNVVILKTQLIP